MNGLLLGNGINISASTKFTTGKIIERIKNLLSQATYFLPIHYNVSMLENLEKKLETLSLSKSIEEIMYELVKDITQNYLTRYNKNLTTTNFLEITTLLKIIIINAIFIDNGKMIDVNIDKNLSAKVISFEKVFSLNYYEYWDVKGIACYLHGCANVRESSNDDILYDENLYKTDIDYNDSIESLQIENFYFPIRNINELILIPSKYKLNKQQYFDLNEQYDQYGFLITPKMRDAIITRNIYKPLTELESVSLFGVSPFGDDLLIESLKSIPKIIIYIYKKDCNINEVTEWSKKLPSAILIDSSLFTHPC